MSKVSQKIGALTNNHKTVAQSVSWTWRTLTHALRSPTHVKVGGGGGPEAAIFFADDDALGNSAVGGVGFEGVHVRIPRHF